MFFAKSQYNIKKTRAREKKQNETTRHKKNFCANDVSHSMCSYAANAYYIIWFRRKSKDVGNKQQRQDVVSHSLVLSSNSQFTDCFWVCGELSHYSNAQGTI